jgi:hypothetical protein
MKGVSFFGSPATLPAPAACTDVVRVETGRVNGHSFLGSPAGSWFVAAAGVRSARACRTNGGSFLGSPAPRAPGAAMAAQITTAIAMRSWDATFIASSSCG